jgi:excisionase family DNA binding protein
MATLRVVNLVDAYPATDTMTAPVKRDRGRPRRTSMRASSAEFSTTAPNHRQIHSSAATPQLSAAQLGAAEAEIETQHERVPMAPDGQLVVTVAEAARRLSISRNNCYTLVSSGKLPSLLIGRLRRIPIFALDEYINQGVKAMAAQLRRSGASEV